MIHFLVGCEGKMWGGGMHGVCSCIYVYVYTEDNLRCHSLGTVHHLLLRQLLSFAWNSVSRWA